ncbi:MAG: ABC transporter permease [Microvirga sp.]|nr:ABC transporter permease [Microvirga sp.]
MSVDPKSAGLDISLTATEAVEPSRFANLRRRGLRHVGVMVGGVVLVLVVFVALFAPLIAPEDPYAQDLTRRLLPPIWHADGSWSNMLGTDALGRDYLSRVLHGVRISLLIGLSAVMISAVIGIFLGLMGGYFGGRIDSAVVFILTCRLALPVVIVALAVVALVGPSLQLVILVLGLLIWDRFAVVMRSSTQQVRSLDYINAARALGCSTPRILWSEILPIVAPNLIVVATLEIANAILLEAALSFLGLGVPPPLPSLGLMISEAKGLMIFEPWVIGVPGVVLFVMVLAINLFGDGVRDLTARDRSS